MHHRTKKHHYYMRSLILLGFSLVLAHLLWTGSITFYLAPRLHTLCYVTFVILLLLTGSSFWQIRQAKNQSEEICDCGGLHGLPSSRWSSTFVYGLFLLPVFMGLFMPDKVLDSAIAKQKGINLLQGDAKKLLSKETEKNRVDATNNSVDIESSSSQANTSASTNLLQLPAQTPMALLLSVPPILSLHRKSGRCLRGLVISIRSSLLRCTRILS